MVALLPLALRFVRCRRATVAQLCDGTLPENTMYSAEVLPMQRVFRHMVLFEMRTFDTKEGRVHAHETPRLWILAECVERADAAAYTSSGTDLDDMQRMQYDSHMLCIQNMKRFGDFSNEMTDALRRVAEASGAEKSSKLREFISATTHRLRRELHRLSISSYKTDSGLVLK
jgi:hypothetical protein